MVTVGLIKELNYLSYVLGTEVDTILTVNRAAQTVPVFIKLKDGFVDIRYHNEHIWHERVEGPTSMFGVESCDSISRAIACLDNQDPSWTRYRYIETT